MALATLLLVLASAFLHAAWNALLKRASDLEAASMGIIATALAATTALAFLLPGPAFPDGPSLLWGLAAGVFEGLYFLALSQALARSPLGWSYTWMRGGSLLLVWPVSLACLGEPLRPSSAAAVLVVCAGLGLMGLAPHRASSRGGWGWAVLVASTIAGYTLCYKMSLAHHAGPVALFAVSMAVALPIQVLVRSARGSLRASLRLSQPGLALGAGLLSTASFVSYLVALSLGGAGVMATLRNTSVVFAVLFSWLLGDRPSARQWAGAGLVAAGAAGLAWRP